MPGKLKKTKISPKPPGLTATLSIAYVALMIIALLIFGGLLMFFYSQSNQEVIETSHEHLARDAATKVSNFIKDKTNLLTAFLRLENPLEPGYDKRKEFLEGLLAIHPSFRHLVLLDNQNRIVTQAARFSVQTSGEFNKNLENHPLFYGTQKKSYISPVYIDPFTSEPMIILCVPVRNVFNDYFGYLAAELNLKFMWELVDNLKVENSGKVYVVNRQGVLIAFGDTARVLKGENVIHLKIVSDFVYSSSAKGYPGVKTYKGITGELVVGTYIPLVVPDWAVIVEVSWGEAYRIILRDVMLSSIIFLVFSILAGLLGIIIARRLAYPIVHLTRTASLIAAGSATEPVKIIGPKEVVSLSSAFNSMTSQLLQSHVELKAQLVEIEKSREALRESEERFRNIINNANEIIYTLSPEGIFTFVSPAWTRLLGHPVSDVEGQHFSQFINPEDLEVCEEFLGKVLSTGKPQQGINYRIKHMDGTWRWHTSVGSRVAEARGSPHYYVGIAQDITWSKKVEEDRVKLEQQLFQAQKMESIGRLAGGVAHDFNNMLNVILGYAELIRLDLSANDPNLKKIKEIERAAGHSRDITRQLLAFSRKQIISPVSLDMNKVIEDNLKMLKRLIGEDIDIRFYPAKDIWKVELDPSQLNQIIYNLAINARDALPDGGKLTIETSNASIDATYCDEHIGFSPGNYVVLSVSDNGMGMDKETQAHLFEPFFTTKEVGEGTGLGLATIYGIIKQNGGFINVYSEPGQGTTFRIYFNRITEKTEVKNREAEPSIKSAGGTILLVEDDEMVRSMTTIALERIGYNVLELETPTEALSIIEKGDIPFVLLITDVVMPEMNGIELKNKIAAVQPDIKVLFMSGYTANTIVHHGVLDKNVHFIQKPFNLKELAKKVRESIEG
ncbi:MAG: PAS domain S-box protein [Spirochaetales bacterium]|nr:PAS domain S-box protein [Spirochaetales bacterium]